MELVLKDAQSALTVSETTFGRDFNEALVHPSCCCLCSWCSSGYSCSEDSC